MPAAAVAVERSGPVATVVLDRPEVRNAVDPETAARLAEAFLALDRDPAIDAIVLWGAGGTFCAGADLSVVARGWDPSRLRAPDGSPTDAFGPMGPTRLELGKPVIAAVAGHAVAGGLELALWCDLRVAEADATFGVFCRRWGVPLIDGGTVRLPRVVGAGRAMDMILTGRAVAAEEALAIGLVNRVVPTGEARRAAESLAREIAAFPQRCVRADRASALAQWSLPAGEALSREFAGGFEVLASGEAARGARKWLESRVQSAVGRRGASRPGRRRRPPTPTRL
jgi:enoyl-CoA hydratase